MRLADRCRLETGLSQCEIPTVHIGDLQPIEPDFPQVRLDLVLDITGKDLSGGRSSGTAQRQPALDEDTEVTVVPSSTLPTSPATSLIKSWKSEFASQCVRSVAVRYRRFFVAGSRPASTWQV